MRQYVSIIFHLRTVWLVFLARYESLKRYPICSIQRNLTCTLALNRRCFTNFAFVRDDVDNDLNLGHIISDKHHRTRMFLNNLVMPQYNMDWKTGFNAVHQTIFALSQTVVKLETHRWFKAKVRIWPCWFESFGSHLNWMFHHYPACRNVKIRLMSKRS